MSNCSFVYDTRVPFKNNIRYWRQHYTKSIKMVIQTQCYLLSICLNRSNKTYHYLNSTKLYLHFDYLAGEKFFVFKYLSYPLVFRCPISFIRIYLLRVQTLTKPCIVQICKNFHYKQQKKINFAQTVSYVLVAFIWRNISCSINLFLASSNNSYIVKTQTLCVF